MPRRPARLIGFALVLLIGPVSSAQYAAPSAIPPMIARPYGITEIRTPPGRWILTNRPRWIGQVSLGPIWVWIPDQPVQQPAPAWTPSPCPPNNQQPAPPTVPAPGTPNPAPPAVPPLEINTPPAVSEQFPAIKPLVGYDGKPPVGPQ